MPLRIDLNCDMGESLGHYRMGNDEDAVRHITSSNLACGFHASDPATMARAVNLCGTHGVRIGAHPGYPDLWGFGRRFMEVTEEELIHYVIYQVGALCGFLKLAGVPLQHVKLHGALYHELVRREGLFLRMAEAVKKAFGNVIFVTLGTTRTAELKKRCAEEGIRVALEAFPDRGYTAEGELLDRSEEGAVFRDGAVIAARAISMAARGGVESVDGRWIPMEIDTICIHGDNRESIGAAGLIRRRAAEVGIEVVHLGAFL